MRTLVLGEALVDLLCERPVASLAQADALRPHVGGAAANVAVTAARLGADVALAGGAGEDAWGTWLAERLAAEGVSTEHFALVAGARTPLACIAVDAAAEPDYLFYGEGLPAIVADLGARVEAAVEDCGALYFPMSLLTGEAELTVARRARERALALDRPIVFDPNLRLDRWENPARAADAAREWLADAFLVKCNRTEARLLSGEADPERAAAGLLAGGARHVVITLGADGALLRGGGLRLDVPGAPARPVDATGGGDTIGGVLLARLGATDFYPPALAASLSDAVHTAARAVERWGALA